MNEKIFNGNLITIYGVDNTQSGSIQYTDSKLSIKGNSAGSGVLITDGRLSIKDAANVSTASITYINNLLTLQGNPSNGSVSIVGSTLIYDGWIHLNSPSTLYTGSLWFDGANLNVNRDLHAPTYYGDGSHLANLNAQYLNGTKSTQLIHNSMSGLQGSESAVQFYHLTQNQYNQLRTYFISTGSPDPNSGSNGDIWLTYQE